MNTIITITGPSCSGKSTLAAYLDNHGIPEVQSFTTRSPREGEAISTSATYSFVTREWAEAIHVDDVIERVEFNGNLYGNTVNMMNRALGRGNGFATVVVEPQGVKHWRDSSIRLGFRHFAIYLSQTHETLMDRFAERFKSTKRDAFDYEVQRMQHMIKVELPTWPDAFAYDLKIHGLDQRSTMSGGVTSVMVLGLIRLELMKPNKAA